VGNKTKRLYIYVCYKVCRWNETAEMFYADYNEYEMFSTSELAVAFCLAHIEGHGYMIHVEEATPDLVKDLQKGEK